MVILRIWFTDIAEKPSLIKINCLWIFVLKSVIHLFLVFSLSRRHLSDLQVFRLQKLPY